MRDPSVRPMLLPYSSRLLAVVLLASHVGRRASFVAEHCWGHHMGMHYSFSSCCLSGKDSDYCFDAPFSFEDCCTKPLLRLVGNEKDSCFRDEAAYMNCCVAGRMSTGFGSYQAIGTDVAMGAAEYGDACWTPDRTKERCCHPEHGLAASSADLVSAVMRLQRELAAAQQLLQHRKLRLIEFSGTQSVLCPPASLLVNSTVAGSFGGSFPAHRLCVRAEKDLVDETFRIDGYWHCGGVAWLVERLVAFTARPQHVVEVGAHIGACSVGLALLGNSVSAVEPNPSSASLLNASVRLNQLQRRVRLAVAAASNIFNPGTLIERCGNSGHSFVRYANVDGLNVSIANTCNSYNIRSAPLLSLVGFRRKHIDLIKVDVEGHEAAVFCGGMDVLIRDKPVLLFELAARFKRNTQGFYGHQLEGCLSRFRSPGRLESYGILLLRLLSNLEYNIFTFVEHSLGERAIRCLRAHDFNEIILERLDDDLVAVPREHRLDLFLTVETSC